MCKIGLRCSKNISFKGAGHPKVKNQSASIMCWLKHRGGVDIASFQMNLGSQGFWRHDELHWTIFIAFLHFETSPHLLQLFRRMLKRCFVWRLRNFKRISLHRCEKTMNTFRFWMNCSFKASCLTRDSPCFLKLNITSYLWLWTSPGNKVMDSELL